MLAVFKIKNPGATELPVKLPHWSWTTVLERLGVDPTPALVRRLRSHYLNVLAPGLAFGPWTPEEDHVLLRLQAAGVGWADLMESLPMRSAEAIRMR